MGERFPLLALSHRLDEIAVDIILWLLDNGLYFLIKAWVLPRERPRQLGSNEIPYILSIVLNVALFLFDYLHLRLNLFKAFFDCDGRRVYLLYLFMDLFSQNFATLLHLRSVLLFVFELYAFGWMLVDVSIDFGLMYFVFVNDPLLDVVGDWGLDELFRAMQDDMLGPILFQSHLP